MHGLIEIGRGKRKTIAIIAVHAEYLSKLERKLGARQSAGCNPAASGPNRVAPVCCLTRRVNCARSWSAFHAMTTYLPSPGCRKLCPKATITWMPWGRRSIPSDAALGWGMGAYLFDRYLKPKREAARLVVERGVLRAVAPQLEAVCRVRDLVNTPTEDMGPAELASTIKQLAHSHGAKFREWVGERLLKANFPAIHAVGRADIARRG